MTMISFLRSLIIWSFVRPLTRTFIYSSILSVVWSQRLSNSREPFFLQGDNGFEGGERIPEKAHKQHGKYGCP